MAKKLKITPTKDQLYREAINHLRHAVVHSMSNDADRIPRAMAELDKVAHVQRILIDQELALIKFEDDVGKLAPPPANPRCLACEHLGRHCGRHLVPSNPDGPLPTDPSSFRPHEAKPTLDLEFSNETALAMFGRYVLQAMTDYEQWSADMLDEIADRAKALNLIDDNIEFRGRSDLLYRESEVEKEASNVERAMSETKRQMEENL